MPMRDRARGERNPLPEGSLAVGAGLLVLGLTAYGFLVLAGRALGPERYASLSGLWFLAFFAGPGFFVPLEQEVSRALAHRRAQGMGGGPVVRRAALAGGLLSVVLVAVSVAGSQPLLEHLFDHEVLLLVGLLLTLVGYYAEHLSRGTLSGQARFAPYGMLLGVEGVLRLTGAAILFVVGVETAGPYGLAIGLPPLLAVVLVMRSQRGLLEEGPPAPWAELSSALGYLVLGAVLAQLLINAAPLAAKILATEDEQELAGRFIAGVVVARIPVFLFQAVQAALLPKLAGLAGAGKHADFRQGLRRLLAAMATMSVFAVTGALTLGPWALRTLFGEEFELGRRDLGLLATASVVFMMALALSQALIALRGHARAALGWVLAMAAFVTVTALGSELLLRVEQGFLAGSTTAACFIGGALALRMRSGVPDTADSLVEAIAQEPVEP